jgi:hypothetical protein
MKTSRKTVDWPWPVWSTRDEELLQRRSGLDPRRHTAPLSEERGELFFLDIPSSSNCLSRPREISPVEPATSFCGPRQCLRVDKFPDLRHFSISNGNVEDPLVLERLIRSFDLPRSDADDKNPVALRHEFGRLWIRRLYLFGRFSQRGRQSRMPAVCASQRPVSP